MNGLLHNSLDVAYASAVLLSTQKLKDCVADIVELIKENALDNDSLTTMLAEHGIESASDIKNDLLDLVLDYIRVILQDFSVSDREMEFIQKLKQLFRIQEGDFYHFKRKEIEALLQVQFDKIYFDGVVDRDEKLHNSRLQELFDLGYDQFDAFKEKHVLKALENGADIANLDTALNTSKVASSVVALRKKMLDQRGW